MNVLTLSGILLIVGVTYLLLIIGCMISALFSWKRAYAVFFFLTIDCTVVLLGLCLLLDLM